MAVLSVRTGSQAGTEFSLDRPVVRIGRGSASDIPIADSQASRQHAEITRSGDQYFIRDAGSTNGTFVNGQRVTGTQPLRPGDEVRIGDTTFSYLLASAVSPVAQTGWEVDLYSPSATAQPRGRGPLVWALAGLAVVLLIAAAVAAFLLLRDDDETDTPVAVATIEPTAAQIEPAPTATPTAEQAALAPSAEPLVEPITVQVPTVPLEVTAAVPVPTTTVQPPAQPPVQPPAQPPVQPPVQPGGTTISPEQLEQLPEAVSEYLGNIPPEQLPEAIAAQLESMTPEQVQEMIAALFPGVNPATLPQVVAASFPGMSIEEVEGLFQMVFPGQNIQIPEMGPIGGRLVLGSYDRGRNVWDVYEINTTLLGAGGERELLVEQASEPDYSPDGQWIVYYSWAPDRLGLRLVRADRTGDTQLTTVTDHYYPSFSPDGGRVAFYNQATNAVHVVNRDGSNMREITKGEFPAWSPVGNQIVYRGCLGGGSCGLIVANADGSNPHQITKHANDAAPRWSPNGGQITFHSDRDGNWEIYVINSDGSWLRRITIDPTTQTMPVWSPDGLRIAFRSDKGGQGGVWLTSGIGGPATKLLDAGFNPAAPMLGEMDWKK
ncbi:MAG TPA: FHA domain-containing protein [Anaerolineae bacterium]|nr:FHA domain-containing protein [Anaerolineae bacterium]